MTAQFAGDSAGSISARGLGKKYLIGGRAGASTLREALVGLARKPLDCAIATAQRSTGRKPTPHSRETLWALRDVSFDVQPGEVVGLVGRNGAGKTTLLKMLSRVTTPTEGSARIYGRVGSLLEVGTGFHNELTGRENVYLNGAILGMTRREIDAKFDEIVAFSEISRFIDTPIKRYSSGMQMRLAFAVAASLEPEILLIDEVLAVGDANFQRKCLGTVEEAGSSGRTIIFVSHNMAAVLRLCRRVILLENGRITADGDAATVVRSYLESGSGRMAERVWDDPSRAPGDAVARLRAVRVRNSVGEIAETINIREPLSIEVEYERRDPAGRPSANLHFFNDEGLCLFIANDSTNPESGLLSGTGIVRSVCHVPGDFLAEGTIYVHAALSTYNPLTMHALERDAVAFHVVEDLQLGAARGEYVNELPGVVRPALPWSLEFDSAHLSLPAATSTS